MVYAVGAIDAKWQGFGDDPPANRQIHDKDLQTQQMQVPEAPTLIERERPRCVVNQ